jgi:hypothetical protein
MNLIEIAATYSASHPEQIAIGFIGVMLAFHLSLKRSSVTSTTIRREANVQTSNSPLPLIRHPVNPEDLIPIELVELVGSELEVAAGDKMGRIDQLYLNRRGELVITDTKTRSKEIVRHSDVEQLKRYKDILISSGKYGKKIASYGYIRVVRNSTTSREVKYLRVQI